MATKWLTIVAAAMLTACGSDAASIRAEQKELKAAVCSDLRAGLSILQLARGGVDAGMSEKEVARTMLLAITEQCPEFEADFKASFVYTDWLD